MPTVTFVVQGIPVSAQAKSPRLKGAYRSKVAETARLAMGESHLFDGSVLVELMIFRQGGLRPDCDNVAKLVLDALEGVVYADDRQVEDLKVRVRAIDERFEVAGASEKLAVALARGEPFMYVEVTTEVQRWVIS